MTPNGPTALGSRSEEILAELWRLRERDAPTHGGRLLSYVYDSGRAELDALAGAAAELARPVNGLDPTAFPSIAAMEGDLVRFMRRALGGALRRPFDGGPVVGSVTSGGTESCLLAVKTARDLWRARQQTDDPVRRPMPRIVAPETVHAAFRKAALAFGLEFDGVPCQPDGSVAAADIVSRLGSDVALVVVSAPAYPSGFLDPVGEVAAAAKARGISCHVDACFGGLVLPWWPGLPLWDFRVPGVTSMSADLHKFGYAPKGVSVLLHRGRVRHRAQFFATTRWPGYPVVNPTLLGSRSASPLAAAWAITRRLGDDGFADLTQSCVRSVSAIVAAVQGSREAWSARPGIPGLAIWGSPTGPAVALVADESVPPSEQVDPHHLADEMARLGYRLQHQPGFTQANGVRLPHSVHLTITPVTEGTLAGLITAMRTAADAVRGKPAANPWLELGALKLLGYGSAAVRSRVPGPRVAWLILRVAGAGGSSLPGNMAPLMALVELLPAPVAEALLTELIARVSEP
ncbi:pyridoxal phosphate-dependent decarboxylase family protein [Leucobacter salsicius]|uniref:pyridoxal phosphate-dependent decarboxylase family protein n=1 Tax=Leucobacter salsicius TaxID=664638 RepID=UPI00036391DD|nr:aminotransferase class V-fold PLP-dependent enzyme [Leucobacter salsicius]